MTLQEISKSITQRFEQVDRAREQGLTQSRHVIKHCSLAIRAIHRREFVEAESSLSEAKALLTATRSSLQACPDVYYSGFIQDAEKEYAEARITFAVVTDKPIPSPDDIGVESAPYLNGMAEAVGELRRHILDLLRLGELDRSEEVLVVMDDVYYLLIAMDFPDAVTRGLRRSTDLARGCLERTRGDLTHHMAGVQLEKELVALRTRLCDLERDPRTSGRSPERNVAGILG